MLYVWLGLYAAYFFPPREAAAQLAFMAGAYLAVPVATAPPDVVAAGWLTLVASCSRRPASCVRSATGLPSS